ncbi:hypothetical protein LCGC14_3114210, partial [marine sediment metagenome]
EAISSDIESNHLIVDWFPLHQRGDLLAIGGHLPDPLSPNCLFPDLSRRE